MKLAFLGLGVMGFPMAGHLAKAGHEVTVYNRTAAKAKAWTEQYKGTAKATPAEAASGAEIVFMCVGNDDDVRQVVLGEHGALAGMGKGALLVDHTTASAELARELDAAAKAKGLGFLDAPVSGGQAGAQNGALTVMVGGDAPSFTRAEPVMKHYGRAVTHMGPAGNGQLTKMVNQIMIAGLVQALSEGLNFAMRAGLDAQKAAQVIAKGA
ncbi:MAG TPA: NAD(P)-dependent oxidoreductase, partial [Stellaceae bacterium]|nr:NAD(P)-dependent oxidoreductase [Stellaceae bacterium]